MSEILAANVAAWPEVPLTDVADLIRGVSYPKTDAREEPADGYVPVLRATNIQDARLVLDSDLVYIAERNISAVQRLCDGDIVVATSSGSKYLVGKSAQLHGDWPGSFGAFCAGIRPKSHVESRYLALFLQSPRYWKEISKKALGVNINNLRRGDLETLMLPLPSREVQRQIVAEIEKQFSRLDEAVANLKRVKANLKRYKAAVLKAAVEGSLVPIEAELARREGRTYETGEQLLRRTLETRRRQWKGRRKYREPESPAVTALAELPAGWAWSSILQIADVASGNTPSGVLTTVRQSGELPWFKVGDMNHVDNVRVMRHADAWLDEAGVKVLGLRAFPPGTVLFPKRGGAIATNKKRQLLSRGCADLNIMGITPDPTLAGFFFAWFDGIDLAKLSDGSNVPQINHKDIEPLLIPLPPLAEQHRIVAEVDRCLSLVRGVEAEVDGNLKRAERLRQSILQTSFAAAPLAAQ